MATEKEINSLAIPLLASGSYGFPKGIALRIALSTELYGDIDEYISDNYVEEKAEEG